MSNILIAFLKGRVKKGGKFNIDIVQEFLNLTQKLEKLGVRLKLQK